MEVGEPPDKGDMTVAEFQQVLGRQLATEKVVGADKVDRHIRHRSYHQNGGHMAPLQALEKAVGGGLGSADHHAGGAVALQRVHKLLLPCRRLLTVGKKQHQIVMLHLLAQSRRHLCIEGVGNIVQQQTDLIAALVAQVGGSLVVDIAELVDGLEYPLAGVVGDASLVAQGHGDGGGGNAQMAGNIGNSHIAHGVGPVMIVSLRYID